MRPPWSRSHCASSSVLMPEIIWPLNNWPLKPLLEMAMLSAQRVMKKLLLMVRKLNASVTSSSAMLMPSPSTSTCGEQVNSWCTGSMLVSVAIMLISGWRMLMCSTLNSSTSAAIAERAGLLLGELIPISIFFILFAAFLE